MRARVKRTDASKPGMGDDSQTAPAGRKRTADDGRLPCSRFALVLPPEPPAAFARGGPASPALLGGLVTNRMGVPGRARRGCRRGHGGGSLLVTRAPRRPPGVTNTHIPSVWRDFGRLRNT